VTISIIEPGDLPEDIFERPEYALIAAVSDFAVARSEEIPPCEAVLRAADFAAAGAAVRLSMEFSDGLSAFVKKSFARELDEFDDVSDAGGVTPE
jgi:hypothetical protein